MKRFTDRAGMARHNALSGVGVYQDRRAKLKTVKAPTVVVHGEKDPTSLPAALAVHSFD
jgi:hypothetical protein